MTFKTGCWNIHGTPESIKYFEDTIAEDATIKEQERILKIIDKLAKRKRDDNMPFGEEYISTKRGILKELKKEIEQIQKEMKPEKPMS